MPAARAIIKSVWEARANKIPDSAISDQLTQAGLTPPQIAHVFEMIEFSLNRAFMETLGGSHSADYDGDPYFKASLPFARKQLPPCASVRRERLIIKAAAGTGIFMGLLSVGVVLYYLIDLLMTYRH